MVLVRLNTEIDFGVEQQISSRGFSSTERKISPNINRTDVGAFTDIGMEADKEGAWSSGRSDKICYFTLKEYFVFRRTIYEFLFLLTNATNSLKWYLQQSIRAQLQTFTTSHEHFPYRWSLKNMLFSVNTRWFPSNIKLTGTEKKKRKIPPQTPSKKACLEGDLRSKPSS